MQVIWEVSQHDIERLREFVQAHQQNPFVMARIGRNLAVQKRAVGRAEFWEQMVGMRLTSVQRSGPGSHVVRFLRTRPFPISYDSLQQHADVEAFMKVTLAQHRGIRFTTKIPSDLHKNYRCLEDGEWAVLLPTINCLTVPEGRDVERNVARYLQDKLSGFGPKQARNLLQALGLTRYEIPIDSRITKWFSEFGFPMKLSSAPLSDPGYYEFVLDGIQALCEAAELMPCVVDAAIFASYDGDGWTADNVVY
ncbi:hypothetical protein [Thalassobaculum sp.]|uniref:hypothetical protein n=1 Tax=Thalassobaculum sp. TaxID=2022740 RepID=UPI0032ED97E3